MIIIKDMVVKFLLTISTVICFLLTPYAAMADLQNKQILEISPVTEGLVLEKHRVAVSGGQTLIYVLKADLESQNLKINTMVGQDGTMAKNARITDMAVNNGAVAAVNADFFQMGESGRPIGMTYKDGQMITSPPLRDDMFGWAITRSGNPLIEVFNFSGLITVNNKLNFLLSGINKPQYYEAGGKYSHEDGLLLYDRYWGVSSRGKVNEKDDVAEVFVVDGTVSEILINQPGKKIPLSGFVLAGRGKAKEFILSSIVVGDKINTNNTVTPYGDEIWAGTGGWSLLVDGKVEQGNYPGDINGTVARTVIGYSGDRKTLFLVTVEKSVDSRGFTLGETAQFMVGLGVDRAINLDGGGSATLAVRPLGEDKPVLMNKPQSGSQRLVPTALGFFSVAPQGSLFGLLIKGPDKVVAGEKAVYTAYGYDTYYNPLPVEQEKAVWSLASGPGSMVKNVVHTESSGLIDISISYGGLTATKQVRVMGSEDIKKITVEPSEIVIRPGESIALKVHVTDKDNAVYAMSANNYSVFVDPVIGMYKDGSFRASEGLAVGEIKVTYSNLTAIIPVTVKSDDEAVLIYKQGKPGLLNLKDLTLIFSGLELSGPSVITASYGDELSPDSQRYKLVSAVSIELLGGNSAALANPALISWEYKPEDGVRIAVLQYIDGAWQELPSRVNNEKANIMSRTWELGPMMLVKDESAPAIFRDMSGHWAGDAVSGLAALGIVKGYPENTFLPSEMITRAEFTLLLGKVMGWQPLDEEGQEFRDSKGIPTWARGYIATAVKNGTVNGYEDQFFRPFNPVTRSEMAAMVSRALTLTPVDVQVENIFIDGKDIDTWAIDSVSRVYSAGIVKGDIENKFRAKDKITRAEGAAVMSNILDYLFNP